MSAAFSPIQPIMRPCIAPSAALDGRRNPADFRHFLGEIVNYILRTHRRDTLGLVASGFTIIAIAAALGPLVAAFMLLSFYSALNLAWFVLKSKVLEPQLGSRTDELG